MTADRLATVDPDIAKVVEQEVARQEYSLEFIASENFAFGP
ncbi:MAG: hypothetical protein R6V21_09130 [Pelovirga sp.]